MDSSQEIKQQIRKLKVSFVDVLIGISILLFCAGWLIMREPFVIGENSGEKKIIIYKDELAIIEMPINKDKSISLKSNGVHMVVEIKDKKVRVVSSDCLQQICVRKGWTGLVHDSIICMPNHIIISIEGDDPGYDALSH
jgi:hypothetical protein